MAFTLKKKTEFNYQSPVDMYQDNKSTNKRIMGVLDYQRDILEEYMKQIDCKNIAIEMPTGSGKTLVGLLIAEYRRRKNKEKVLFLCTTNQLVRQVVKQAREQYGIEAIAFCGRQLDYPEKDKSDFLQSEIIGVTTYSSFFATPTFFDCIDVIIMDDVHSSESYIMDNWTMNIQKGTLFSSIADYLRSFIGELEYKKLIGEDEDKEESWCNIVPNALIYPNIDKLEQIIEENVNNSQLYYPWMRIRENLSECNIYIKKGMIQIRPWIAPTMTHSPFAESKQRVLMSATLGKSGELERITGIEKIKRLPIMNGWEKRGVGRKVFVIPRLALDKKYEAEVLVTLQRLLKKSVVLTPSEKVKDTIYEIVGNAIPDVDLFDVKQIDHDKSKFIESKNAMAVIANRFDGIDFPDEESRLLFVVALPKITNLQEKFLVYRMGGTVLYSERIQTRIVQAVGRCTRNTRDSSIVCILGDTIIKELVEHKKLERYTPELRAEIDVGIEISRQYKSVDDIIEHVKSFMENNETWQGAEEVIVERRDGFSKEKQSEEDSYSKLKSSASREVQFQYHLWKKDYIQALECIRGIVNDLNMPKLNGYRSFWNYMGGTIAYYLYAEGRKEYKKVGVEFFTNVLKDNIGVKWVGKLEREIFDESDATEIGSDYIEEVIPQFELILNEYTVKNRLEKRISEILDEITDKGENNGKKFESGQQKLGELLGFISKNVETTGSPDPYWIFDNVCIVSEDKLYKNDKEIPVSHAREVASHEEWIRANERLVTSVYSDRLEHTARRFSA